MLKALNQINTVVKAIILQKILKKEHCCSAVFGVCYSFVLQDLLVCLYG